jgi:hypothetical protein
MRKRKIPQRKRFYVSVEGQGEQSLVKWLQSIADQIKVHIHLDCQPLYGGGYQIMLERAILYRAQKRRHTAKSSILLVDADRAQHSLIDYGFENLIAANIPTENEDIRNKVGHAIDKFRHHKSSLHDRRAAIRELTDVLEYLRPKAKAILSKKDDDDIFNIANNFSIRHYNQLQRDLYNKPIWYSWLFYFFLATIHAVSRLIEEDAASEKVN